MLPTKLKEVRKSRKITQDAVAGHLGVLRQSYSAYERGVSVPDANQLKRLADFFGVSADYFFGGSPEEAMSAQNPNERRLLSLARRAGSIPDKQLHKLIDGFASNIDIVLETMKQGD